MNIPTKLIAGAAARWRRRAAKKSEVVAATNEAVDGPRRVTPKQRETRRNALLAQVRDPIVANVLLERIIEGSDLTGINYLAIGTRRSRSVCRVHLRDSAGRTTGYGTGFLVAPGILMTNHHVIANADEAHGAIAEFQYEYDADGVDKPIVSFDVIANPGPLTNEALDFCLVKIAPRSTDGKFAIEDFGWLVLDPTPGKAILGEYLTIIQHPSGERKQICVRENKLLKYDEGGNTLWYQTDTAAGSSGSPVFNDAWQVVALHHSGVPATNAKGQWLTLDGRVWDQSMDETQVKWLANEGIRVSAILKFLATSVASDPIANAVLHTVPPQAGRAEATSPTTSGTSQEVRGDELQVTIPLRLSLRLDGLMQSGALSPNVTPIPAARPRPAGTGPRVVERVDVDQSNYDDRPGYDPNFIGKGKLSIPLPLVTKAALKRNLVAFGAGAKKASELKYWDYSLLMNKDRRLAFVSAINVDGSLRKGKRDADGDRWYIDTRFDAKYQLGAEFYGAQKTVEVVDRVKNPFDRGHLSARNDAQWGDTADEAKRNGDDSFHWANCSPQHYLFNQGQKLWAGLEDYVITSFAKESSGRASVFNGPIFDGPVSSADENGKLVLNLQGAAAPDPTFGDVAIPKMFFKVVATQRGGKLAVAAFIITQEDLLATVDRIKGIQPLTQERLTEAEARAFQVSVADVARLSALDFSALLASDTDGAQELLASGRPHQVVSFADAILR